MRVYQVVLIAVLAGTVVPVALHVHACGGAPIGGVALAFFLWLNVIIALWEMCLFARIDLIESQHARWAVEYRGRPMDRVKDFFGRRLGARAIVSPSTWAEIWSSYALFDPSYADRRSFGFTIDIGNGISTIVPCLLCLYGWTYDLVPARVLGLVLLIVCYQMWYGTVLYFASFLVNRRWRGLAARDLALFVGLSNGMWLGFPIYGMYVAVQTIYAASLTHWR
jgi:hypothetical protein